MKPEVIRLLHVGCLDIFAQHQAIHLAHYPRDLFIQTHPEYWWLGEHRRLLGRGQLLQCLIRSIDISLKRVGLGCEG